ncbi:hypothetical protein ACRWQM_14235 [Shewanella sp. HL-SH5]|uniref:hypothetical protein n=1 Tax=Shewanella sp. HL-SH5 TaxID=3436241 RepID=UPI003EB9189C
MLNIPPKFDELFAPYLGLRLSAFDNAKLVVAVLAQHQYKYHAAEIILITNNTVHSTPRYAIKWLGLSDNQESDGCDNECHEIDYCWIDCGKINQYEVGFSLIDPIDVQSSNIQVVNTITVPIMTMQQIGFMCVESAHFDHC